MRSPLTDKERAPATADHPSGDQRFAVLDASLKRHQYQQDALIEVLHAAQSLFGYLEDDLLLYVAHNLKLPPSRVYGVATFYHFFSLKPKGTHTCVVCTGTACYVNGANELLADLQRQTRLQVGETSVDGRLSLLTARCLGACGIAPAVVFDGAVAGRQTVQAALDHLKGWRENGPR
jgi:bidirectional [NiFe] hydrogenase diaphorase subunit